jgi:hypothetical protein
MVVSWRCRHGRPRKIRVSQSLYSEIEIVQDVFIIAFTSWPQRGPESAESLKCVKVLI